MFYTYIIHSKSLNKYYCGSTQNFENRLNEHNNGETKSIKHGIPWLLVGYISSNTRSEAVRLEKKIKNRGIKRWLLENEFPNIER